MGGRLRGVVHVDLCRSVRVVRGRSLTDNNPMTAIPVVTASGVMTMARSDHDDPGSIVIVVMAIVGADVVGVNVYGLCHVMMMVIHIDGTMGGGGSVMMVVIDIVERHVAALTAGQHDRQCTTNARDSKPHY